MPHRILNQFPESLRHAFRTAYHQLVHGKDPCEWTFTEIYLNNGWSNSESDSGPGSTMGATRHIREVLPSLFRRYGIHSMLDLPCGDFNWLRHIELSDIEYLGGDIVEQLIEVNTRNYQSERVAFRQLDLLSSDLPSRELIMCRDCLVHLSFADIHSALGNLARTDFQWILMTHFPDVSENLDIETGGWRPLNFTLAPFCLPDPVDLVQETPDSSGDYSDKSLALWNRSTLAPWS